MPTITDQDTTTVADVFPEKGAPKQTPISTQDLVKEHTQLSTLNESMDAYDELTSTTQTLRRVMLDKFLPDALNLDMSVNANTDALMYKSQAAFVAEVRQLLNDVDASAKNHVSIKLKRVDLEQQQANHIDPAELLKAIKLTRPIQVNITSPQPSVEEIETKLEERLAAAGGEILDTELELGGNQLPVQTTEE